MIFPYFSIFFRIVLCGDRSPNQSVGDLSIPGVDMADHARVVFRHQHAQQRMSVD